jgi:enamine deaminase RidA (YjgF/YER057c/UK114 family)
MNADERFKQAAIELGFSVDAELKAGGNYVPLVRNGNDLYISGQLPRIGDIVVVMGRAGTDVTVSEAQRAAKVCTLRALLILQRELGSLEKVKSILRITVYVQSASDFTRQSEVGDGASDLLRAVLGPAGLHSRTSIGVFQLPKNGTVEVDMIACAHP